MLKCPLKQEEYKVNKNLEHSYDLWRKIGSGAIVVQYIINGDANETYQFPTLNEMIAKSDESFLFPQQIPQQIIVDDWCIMFVFIPKTFPTKKDRAVRDKFFQWVIDHSQRLS